VQRLNIAIDVAHAITYLHEYKGMNSARYMFFRSNCDMIFAMLGEYTGDLEKEMGLSDSLKLT